MCFYSDTPIRRHPDTKSPDRLMLGLFTALTALQQDIGAHPRHYHPNAYPLAGRQGQSADRQRPSRIAPEKLHRETEQPVQHQVRRCHLSPEPFAPQEAIPELQPYEETGEAEQESR